MDFTSWGNRRKNHIDLFDDHDNTIATFPIDIHAEQTVDVDGVAWTLSSDKKILRAVIAGGEEFVADAGEKGFARSKRIEISLGDRNVRAINENRNDWVYVDSDPEETKIGQFSGGNSGVRKSYTEFEKDSGLNLQQKVFLSAVTRTELEAKLSSFTLGLFFFILLLMPAVVRALL